MASTLCNSNESYTGAIIFKYDKDDLQVTYIFITTAVQKGL